MQPGETQVNEATAVDSIPPEVDAAEFGAADSASAPYVKKWQKLVSTTNWEKGRIIHEWRVELIAQGASPRVYSDDAWSRRVESVTGQHVGRLRRVHERFGNDSKSYKGLYWSHFQAALDWADAEMWLEGAVQNNWSVAEMRNTRWETMGRPKGQEPRPQDVFSEETDGDAERSDPVSRSIQPDWENPRDVTGPDHSEGADFGDEQAASASPASVRPFENLPALPADLHEGFELFKLAILRHKMSQWSEVASADVLQSIKALEQLVLAPSET